MLGTYAAMEQAKAAVEDSIEEALKASKAATDSILNIPPGQAMPDTFMQPLLLSCQATSAPSSSAPVACSRIGWMFTRNSCFSLQCVACHLVSGCRIDC